MAEGGEERLPDLYDKVWSCWETLDGTDEPLSSYNVQVEGFFSWCIMCMDTIRTAILNTMQCN